MSIGSRSVAAALAAALLVPSIAPTTAQAQCGGRWMGPGPAELGANGAVDSLAIWDPDGPGPLGEHLVASGLFTSINGTPIAGLGIWNGDEWTTLGGGVTGRIYDFATMPDGRLVVGGDLTAAGGMPVRRVAAWDGERWEDLGGGIVGRRVEALLTLQDGTLVAGGDFTNAGGVPTLNVARWNGTVWSPVTGGTNGPVYALAQLANGQVVAGGSFTQAGFTPANSIAAWTGSSWMALGLGVQIGFGASDPLGRVHTLLAMPDGSLIVGGRFLRAGGLDLSGNARWTGTEWTSLGASSSHLFLVDTALLPNGDILALGESAVIRRFNGQTWSTIPPSSWGGFLYSTAVFSDGRVAVGGEFFRAGNFAPICHKLVILDAALEQWSPPIGPITGEVNAGIPLPDGRLIVTGRILAGNGTRSGGIGIVDTNNRITPLDSDQSLTYEHTTIMPDGVLLATRRTGSRTSPGPTQLVGRQDGVWQNLQMNVLDVWAQGATAWDPDLAGPLDPVWLVKGSFRFVDEEFPSGWGAIWNGSTWSRPTLPMNGSRHIVLRDGRLLSYGGYGPMEIWDPEAGVWNAVGPNFSGSLINVQIATEDGGFVVGGRWLRSDGVDLGAVAAWHPVTGWRSLGSLMGGRVDAMVFLRDGRLAATGQLVPPGPTLAMNNAIWDGESWTPMGLDRTQTWMDAIVELPNGDIMVAGSFVNGSSSNTEKLARYRETRTPSVTLQPAPRVVRVGDEVHFSVQGSGDLLNYRWRRNGVNLESGGRVRGAASATLRIFAVHPDDAGLYECVLINPCGTTTSTAALLRIAPAIGSCAYDFNQDGNVDLLDSQQIAQVALSLREPDAAWLDGDVDSDGETTIADAQVLAMYVVSGVCGL